ncbi:hypothetical protein E2562_004668 [Oryza meyeriana var. granulata]|uniref:Uncharacterized protein n=1 Tax=Oryza meyeriana var. granulata TaxID=110450 RepID=A0A6G1DE08_9ORYZ|nr:hypothetical protein E2562_004668 [Oryza meyeriana var. granulata]
MGNSTARMPPATSRFRRVRLPPMMRRALIATSFAKLDYEKVKEVTYYVLKTGVFVGAALAFLLFASFSRLAELFSKDPMVLQIVGSGVLFVSASQPINALAFIFDGLHFGVSDFSYSASSMITVGAIGFESRPLVVFAPERTNIQITLKYMLMSGCRS